MHNIQRAIDKDTANDSFIIFANNKSNSVEDDDYKISGISGISIGSKSNQKPSSNNNQMQIQIESTAFNSLIHSSSLSPHRRTDSENSVLNSYKTVLEFKDSNDSNHSNVDSTGGGSGSGTHSKRNSLVLTQNELKEAQKRVTKEKEKLERDTKEKKKKRQKLEHAKQKLQQAKGKIKSK